jgi:hypothetical protein
MLSFYDQLENCIKMKSKHVLDTRELAEGHIKILHSEGFLEELPLEDLDGGEFYLKNQHEKYRLNWRDGTFKCFPVDSLGEPFNLKAQDAKFYILDHKSIFQRLAQTNGFNFLGEYILGSAHAFLIGTADIGLKKVSWVYVSGGSAEVKHALEHVKKECSYILVSSLDKKLTGFNDPSIHIVDLPTEKPFGLKLKSFINEGNGFTVEDYASMSSFIPVLIDNSTESIYFYGRKVRDSGRDYLYISTLLNSPSGMSLDAITRVLSAHALDKDVVTNDRRELKDALKKAFADEPECLQNIKDILGLNKMRKGEKYKLNFSDKDIVIF